MTAAMAMTSEAMRKSLGSTRSREAELVVLGYPHSAVADKAF
jgi:hypothetical protein